MLGGEVKPVGKSSKFPVISLSIILHGLTAAPFSRFYGKKVAEMGECEEIMPVQEIPTRTGKLLK